MFRKNRYYGINFPMKRGDDGFYFDLTETEKDAVRSNLIHFILTKKGERLMKPSFGTNLYQYLFEPMDSRLITDMEADIRKSVEESFKGLSITKMSSALDFGSNLMQLEIEFSYNNGIFQEQDIVSIKV